MPPLEEVLQRLYDSEINVAIAMLWDSGFDFAFVSYLELEDAATPMDGMQSLVETAPLLTETPWENCRTAAELADAIHRSALEKYPDSSYSRLYGKRPN
jgi:hypothetical protein